METGKIQVVCLPKYKTTVTIAITAAKTKISEELNFVQVIGVHRFIFMEVHHNSDVLYTITSKIKK